MKQECKIAKLDNNEEYFIVNEVTYNNNNYVLLSQIDYPKNMCVRKMKTKNNKTYLSTISEEEYDKVIKLLGNLG